LKQTTTSVLQFKGKLTFEKIGILLNDLKNRKETFDIKPGLYKKLLTLMIEVLENVLKYSDYFEEFSDKYPEYLPEFELNQDEECFILLSRNPVREGDKEVISRKIERINASTEEELKDFYRETITNGMFTEKGGAGLGFIEMAKITDHDLGFAFRPVTVEYSIYELILRINHIDQFYHA